ncbi:hypothetical protein LQ772_16910 [Frateuria edaphi]|jgi:hypothetical protein|uniref:hypothetical protein n=1 Tax=Frateuria TaxID=70411 RepID=UPI001E4F6BE4|nr:hypothetical protein [Frateuria edaphi]UGB45632.1 hypothetical protein LQ772_16910 [Frateuria edaphi]
MDWATLLQLPSTLLWILAALALLFALVQLAALGRRLRARRPFAAILRTLFLLVGLGLALLLAGAGWSLRGYRLLGEEAPVVTVDARILSPQRWALTLTWPDGQRRDVALAGDAWRIEALVLKWKLPAVLAGVPPLYRLDRLSGRYDDPAEEMSEMRTVVDFRDAGDGDLVTLARAHPDWLPMVDTVYGSGAYLPLVDGGHYTVSLMRTGALVARPDDETADRIAHPL